MQWLYTGFIDSLPDSPWTNERGQSGLDIYISLYCVSDHKNLNIPDLQNLAMEKILNNVQRGYTFSSRQIRYIYGHRILQPSPLQALAAKQGMSSLMSSYAASRGWRTDTISSTIHEHMLVSRTFKKNLFKAVYKWVGENSRRSQKPLIEAPPESSASEIAGASGEHLSGGTGGEVGMLASTQPTGHGDRVNDESSGDDSKIMTPSATPPPPSSQTDAQVSDGSSKIPNEDGVHQAHERLQTTLDSQPQIAAATSEQEEIEPDYTWSFTQRRSGSLLGNIRAEIPALKDSAKRLPASSKIPKPQKHFHQALVDQQASKKKAKGPPTLANSNKEHDLQPSVPGAFPTSQENGLQGETSKVKTNDKHGGQDAVLLVRDGVKVEVKLME